MVWLTNLNLLQIQKLSTMRPNGRSQPFKPNRLPSLDPKPLVLSTLKNKHNINTVLGSVVECRNSVVLPASHS